VVVLPDGSLGDRYDKVRIVPFGEFLPLRSLIDLVPGQPTDLVPRDAIAGEGPAVLDTPKGPVAVAISWEVFFGGRTRDGVKHGGLVILNPTNGSSYRGTILQTQQIASSRLRALETGRWVVQVAPTGFSAFVTPDGTVIDRTRISEQTVGTRTVEQRTGDTWYMRIGDKPIVAAALAVLAVAMLLGRLRSGPKEATSAPRRRSSSPTASTRGSATSGGAAASQLGRRPRLVSPYNVNWLTSSTALVVSATEQFMTPLSSSMMRRFQMRSASLTARAGVSSWVTPTSTHRPGPMSPTAVRPRSTVTRARLTRCTSARTDGTLPTGRLVRYAC